MLSAIFIAVQLNMRKRKKQHDFEVLPVGLEIVKITLVVLRLYPYALAGRANGIPLVLILLASLIFIYTFIAENNLRAAYLRARRQ